MSMDLKTEKKNDIITIFVKEERLDAHNSGELKIEMQKLFESGAKNILVDLKDVRFIDSSGLGALVSGFKNAISHQGNLKLSSLAGQLAQAVQIDTEMSAKDRERKQKEVALLENARVARELEIGRASCRERV